MYIYIYMYIYGEREREREPSFSHLIFGCVGGPAWLATLLRGGSFSPASWWTR